MNRDHASPDNVRQPADDAVDSVRLADIEQQLQRWQPRRPELDVDALACSASDSDESVALARPRNEQVARNSKSWIGSIAVSWMCGAVAGTLVTFMLLGQGAPAETSSVTTTTLRSDQPNTLGAGDRDTPQDLAEQTRPDGTSSDIAPWSRSELAVAVMLLDPYYRETAGGMSSLAMRAGNFVRHKVESESWRYQFAASPAPQNSSEAAVSDAPWETAPRPAPRSSFTRERLRRELLDPNKDSVL